MAFSNPSLANEACEACRADAPPVSDAERAEWLQQLPHWQVITENGVLQLRREFHFRNFAEALAFTNRVGALAEEAGHHPALLTEWGKVIVRWWTHDIQGLHRNDFILAARTDTLMAVSVWRPSLDAQ